MISEDVTIFTRMSALAREHGALNLGQGFPDAVPPDFLLNAVRERLIEGPHQYAPMQGLPELREAIAEKFQLFYGFRPDAVSEITVTAGGTQALFTAVAALVNPGDEVIIPEPAYDCYAPAVKLKGGHCVFVALHPDTFRPDWEAIRKALSPRTRLIVFNTPHNPTGAVWEEEDYRALEKLAEQHAFLVLSDEVYEHILFDGRRHRPLFSLPALKDRCLSVYSFGKVFHCTGWKVGYVAGGSALMHAFRQVHQYNVFSVNAPFQAALAEAVVQGAWFRSLAPYFQHLRDRFLELIRSSRFRFTPAGGTYFQLLDYGAISEEDDLTFAERLTREHKITTIPVSFFFHNRRDNHLIRVCFGKSEQTLQKAAEILCRI